MIKTAIVLAGGKGTRLRPLTFSLPKSLVPVGNAPLLYHILRLLEIHSFNKVIIIVNYLSKKIIKYINEVETNFDLEIYIPSITSLDTADGVRKCRNMIDDDFIVIMGDILTNVNLRSFLSFHERKGGIASLILKEVDNPLEYGIVILENNSKISLFIEKPKSLELYLIKFVYSKYIYHSLFYYENLANTGIYAFKQEILDILEDNPELMDWGRHVFPYLVDNNQEVYGWVTKAYWRDIGNPRSYLEANIEMLEEAVKPLKPLGEKRENVWMKGKISVSKRAKLLSPVALGENVIIEDDAIIGPYAVIGNNCYVGKGTKVTNSVLWDDVRIGENSIINKAIIANNVRIGSKVRINEEVVIGEGISIKDNMLINREK